MLFMPAESLSVLLVVVRSAILRGYKYIYGKVVLDVGAGTGDHRLLSATFSAVCQVKTCCI